MLGLGFVPLPARSAERLRARRAAGIGALALVACLALSSARVVAEPMEGLAPEVAAPGVEVRPVDEDTLLRDACRYLNLSHAQITHLLLIARHADRSLEAFDREEARIERATRAQAETSPEVAARLQAAQDERRAQAAARVAAGVAPSLARFLTREQIALAWRLQQGKPPEYAEADPELLDPSAGFVMPAAPIFLSDRVMWAPGSTARRLQLGGGERQTLPSPDTELEVLDGKPLALPASPTQDLLLYRRSVLTDELGSGWGMSGSLDPRPFPQLVVETNDLRDLLPVLQPLAARLFFSPRFVAVLSDALRDGLGVSPNRAPRRAPPLSTLPLVRNYRMETGLRDLAGHGPELTPLGGHIQHGCYVFDAGQGLHLPDAGVTDHYAVQFSFQQVGGESYQKLIDFKDGTRDTGLYTYQGKLTFYTLAVGGVPQPGVEHRIRLERDRGTRIVRAYLDLKPVFAFIDLDDEAVFQEGRGTLFVDDRTTQGEQGPGAVRSIMIWGPGP
jgi:hypothetical protein